MKPVFLLFFFILFSMFGFSCNQGINQGNHTGYMIVTKIVDGDTFWADDGSEQGIKIRLIGVDAPESRNTGLKKIGFYGQESKVYLTKLLTGKEVRLVYDVGKMDRYDRTLAYVYLKDGTFINADLVKQGYAMVMTVPPNVIYAEKFVQLERRARKQNRGLWNENELK